MRDFGKSGFVGYSNSSIWDPEKLLGFDAKGISFQYVEAKAGELLEKDLGWVEWKPHCISRLRTTAMKRCSSISKSGCMK